VPVDAAAVAKRELKVSPSGSDPQVIPVALDALSVDQLAAAEGVAVTLELRDTGVNGLVSDPSALSFTAVLPAAPAPPQPAPMAPATPGPLTVEITGSRDVPDATTAAPPAATADTAAPTNP
jgi:hypothetical protein